MGRKLSPQGTTRRSKSGTQVRFGPQTALPFANLTLSAPHRFPHSIVPMSLDPIHAYQDILSTSDVIFGMHGAGWTNLLFVFDDVPITLPSLDHHSLGSFLSDSFMKRGATTMQMFPHGWRLPDNSTVRGALIACFVLRY